MKRILGSLNRATTSSESSVQPSPTTMSSQSPRVCASTDPITNGRMLLRLNVARTTDTAGAGSGLSSSVVAEEAASMVVSSAILRAISEGRSTAALRGRPLPLQSHFAASTRISMSTRRFALALIVTSVVALLFASAPPFARAEGATPVLLVVGDSISAGYGLAKGSGWVDLLARRIEAQKLSWRVINASISGDTTAGGRARLAGLLTQHKPAIVIVEVGGDDGLRGGNLRSTQDNLDAKGGPLRK